MSTERAIDVIVVGGGLAGISCALRLVENGLRVRVLETRKKLGGRATSFLDVRTGEWLDNCQHVVLGCCTNYMDLLERLGSADKIRWTRQQHWIEEGGRVSVVRPWLLPAPLHFTMSVLRAGFLDLSESVAIGRACSAMARIDRSTLDDITFGSYLRSLHQPERTVRRFWSPVIVSACNLDVDRVSAGAAVHVFQEGFLASEHAADMGVPTVPLLDLYKRAETLLGDCGVELGCGVSRILPDRVDTTDGRTLHAGRVVCATPFERTLRIVDERVQESDSRFEPLKGFVNSPIIGVHMVFDVPVLELPHAVLVDRGTQWLFRKDEHGCRIHAVISGADEWIAMTEQEIAERVLSDVNMCLPVSRRARLLSVRAVKEKFATFAPVPGLASKRPGVAGSSGLVLAGDYTDTGWPSTMEGAVRSGYAAAAAVLGIEPARLLAPSVRVSRLSRWLGLRVA